MLLAQGYNANPGFVKDLSFLTCSPMVNSGVKPLCVGLHVYASKDHVFGNAGKACELDRILLSAGV